LRRHSTAGTDRASTSASFGAVPPHQASTPAEQLKRILASLQDIPSLSFLQEKHYDDASAGYSKFGISARNVESCRIRGTVGAEFNAHAFQSFHSLSFHLRTVWLFVTTLVCCDAS
jgi:hypothetical protein